MSRHIVPMCEVCDDYCIPDDAGCVCRQCYTDARSVSETWTLLLRVRRAFPTAFARPTRTGWIVMAGSGKGLRKIGAASTELGAVKAAAHFVDELEAPVYPMCEGCGIRAPDVRGTAWSDHDWCDECNGGKRR